MSHIKVGDLVMVVKPTQCCENVSTVGKVFTAAKIHTHVNANCKWCGSVYPVTSVEMTEYSGCYVNIVRLKKIEPLGEDDKLEQSSERLLETFGG